MMDPLENLAQQRELARRIIALIDEPIPEPDDSTKYDEAKADRNERLADLAHELAELVQALDEWGGFDPYAPF